MGLVETLEQKLRRRKNNYFSNSPNYSFSSDTQAIRKAGQDFFSEMEQFGRWLVKNAKKQLREMGIA